MSAGPPTTILIVGGGFVGLYSALGLEKRLHAREAELVLVSPESFMTYQPFLPEAASGNIEPRHVVVPLRSALRRTRLVTGEVVSADHTRRRARIRSVDGAHHELGYDVIVLALGSVSRTLPIPGLAEHGVGFTSVAEAIYLRNQVISRMDAAESSADETARRRALTFVFVGAGYAGVEALAELEDLARDAARGYQRVKREDMRWILVEAAPKILPEMAPRAGSYALETLRERGVEVFLATTLESAAGGRIQLSNGESFEADTLVWTAGVRANPVLANFGFELDDRGRVVVDEFLRVRGVEGAWAAGDCAAVPDLVTGGLSPATAQHALREARALARNVAATLEGHELEPFRYRNMGGLASLGRYKGVARILVVSLRGFPAWLLHRTYHVLMIPTLNRKIRVILDWTVGLFFRRDVVQLGSLQRPRRPFAEAAQAGPRIGPGST